MDWASVVQILLPGVGVVVLAMLSGAGGSALLELYYKPLRERKRAARLLLSEILLNTDLALLQANARDRAPKKIPADFDFSKLAWNAAAGLLSELPLDLLKRVVLLYNRYDSCNHLVNLYSQTFDELKSLPRRTAIPKNPHAFSTRCSVLRKRQVKPSA